MNQPTEEDVKKAYEDGCSDIKRVMKTLFPDAFKAETLKPGDRVASGGDKNNLWTVIGYNSNKAAAAYYESIGGVLPSCAEDVVFVMAPGGRISHNRQNHGWWVLQESA